MKESDESDDEADVEARVKNATPEQISACPFLQSKHAAAAKGPNTDATAPRGTVRNFSASFSLAISLSWVTIV